MGDPTPHSAKRELGRHLKELRLKAHKNQDDVTASGICKSSTLSNIENGITSGAVKQGTVAALLDLYEVGPGETRDYLKSLAIETGQSGQYGQFQRTIRLLFERAQKADRIWGYGESFVPGYFQTREYMYATALYHLPFFGPGISTNIDETIDERLRHHEAILRRLDQGSSIEWIIGFSAIMQHMGGPKVMAAQVERLREIDSHPNVTLYVVPPSVGAHACQRRSLIMLEFDNPRDPTVVYEEGGSGPPQYLERPRSEIDRHRRMLQDSAERSLPLKRYLDEYSPDY